MVFRKTHKQNEAVCPVAEEDDNAEGPVAQAAEATLRKKQQVIRDGQGELTRAAAVIAAWEQRWPYWR